MSEQQDFSNASMLELFRMEMETHSAVLNEGLVAFASGTVREDVLAALMRAAHSIKGAARIIGWQPGIDVAHAMEDCFVRAQEGTLKILPEHVERFLLATDFLTQCGQENTASSEIAAKASEIVKILQTVKTDGGTLPADLSTKKKRATAVPAPGERPSSRARADAPVETVPSAPEAKPAHQAHAGTSLDPNRAVRVNAESLSRLMGLAGETLVEAGWLERFEKSLGRLQEQQGQVAAAVYRLRDHAAAYAGASPATTAFIHELQRRNEEFQELLAERMQVFETYALRTDNLSHRLYREVIASRMRPFADGVHGFPRLVHDVARKLGKKVRFEVLGKSIEVDRDILEKLEAPINHLLRNALDHGLEPPPERLAAGKPEQGRLTLEAVHKGGMLFVTVTDDGRGVDIERVRKKIVERGLAPADMAARMTEHEVMEFLFLPGFSTAQQVTEISGRGVGLDVVKTMVQEVSGHLRITSRPGHGCTFHVQLPITLSVISTLQVEICGEPYAFPLARIAHVSKVRREDIHTLENYQYFKFDGQSIGLVPAQQVLELDQEPPLSDEFTVVVVGERGEHYGLAVDGVLGEREIVVRPMDARLGKVPNISAAALTEDGRPLLIVDVEDLIYSIRNLLSGGRLKKVIAQGPVSQKARKRILVVDDSLTVREVERKLLENKGYEVTIATDGAEGWIALRSGSFDLVITDVDMPRLNGIELVGAIRTDARYKNLPVVIVSYKDREEDRLKGMEAGANYYLTKSSFHDESLLNAVFDLIGEAR